MDSAYWDVTSLEGSNYTVCAVDSCTAYYGGFHCELRSAVTLAVGKWIERIRGNPELNCPTMVAGSLKLPAYASIHRPHYWTSDVLAQHTAY